MNAGTYTMSRTLNRTALQVYANGHVTINGAMTMNTPAGVYYGLEITNSSAGPGSTFGGDGMAMINCQIHDVLPPNAGGGVGMLIPAGISNVLMYGCLMWDNRHNLYLQNVDTEPPNWIAHCFFGEPFYSDEPGNAYNLHLYSSGGGALYARNLNVHENIFANGPMIPGGADGNAEIVCADQFIGNLCYRASLLHWGPAGGKPTESIWEDNRLYENTQAAADAIGGAHFSYGDKMVLSMIRTHGQGETSFTYHNATSLMRNLVYNASNASDSYIIDLRSDRYGPAGHDPGVPLLRTQDTVDNNSYYDFFRANCNANGVNVQNITTLAGFRAATLAAGHQWDVNSTFTAGAPPNYYNIKQNEYNPDRAMLFVVRYTGANVPIVLPRIGDIYDIHDEWGTALYTGASSYNITQHPFFGIIKYTGGAMPQFARPNSDFNNPGVWTNQAASTTNIYLTIDETVADDADYIQSPVAPTTTKVYVTKLSSVTDPVSSTGHVLRWRYNKDAAGGAQINLVAELRQGYVSEASLGTLIVSRSFTNVSDTFVTDAYTLSGGEADAITNYGDLYLRFTATQV